MDILKFFLYLILTFFLMGILIFVHELGHYIAARLCKVPVREFAIGMGKRLGGFTSKKTGTVYSFRLFPIGGYVAMAGDDDEFDDPNGFNHKSIPQKIFILASGAAMNFLTGLLAMLVLTVGMTAGGYRLPSTVIGDFDPGATSYVTGLEIGDRILSVDGTRVHTGYDLSYEIMFNGNEPVDIVVERNGQEYLIRDVHFESTVAEGIELGEMDFYVVAAAPTPANVLKTTLYRSTSSIKMVFDSIGGLITGRFSLSSMSGPIGVTSVVSDVAAQPMAGWNILYLFALIAMNLGVMNLLPIPALDGGRIFFRIIELLRFGKPIKPEFEAKVHGVGMMLLLLFTAFIAVKDVFALF